jgi:hypothetical protein
MAVAKTSCFSSKESTGPLQNVAWGDLMRLNCLKANVQRTWEIAKLKNLSLLTSMTSDVKWQHEQGAKLDEMTG